MNSSVHKRSWPSPGSLLATVIGTPALFLATLAFSLIVLALLAVGARRTIEGPIRTWARLALWLSGVRLMMPEAAPKAAQDPCIVMANHTSLFDIPVLFSVLPGRVRFLAKKQLFSIPVFGWALRAAGFVSVDRGSSRGGAHAFGEARQRAAEGYTLAIFPEETRSLDGELLPFRSGGALLAKATSLPVVPLAIRGALQVRPRDSWMIRPGTISVDYGRVLYPNDFEHRKALNAAVRDQISGLLAPQ